MGSIKSRNKGRERARRLRSHTALLLKKRGADLGVEVRHPPRSGWLDEWGRLKGGRPVQLGGALKRAFVDGLELSACSIRALLFADVLANLLQFKADRGHSITACP
jgi:hypothetical protein